MNELYSIDSGERSLMYAKSTHFNLHYNTTKKYLSVYDALSVLCKKQSTKEVWCLVTNIARAIKQNATYLQIPKQFSVYTKNKQEISRTKLFSLFDELVLRDYLVFYKGGFINVKKDEYVTSLYEITDKMKLLWVGIDIDEELET